MTFTTNTYAPTLTTLRDDVECPTEWLATMFYQDGSCRRIHLLVSLYNEVYVQATRDGQEWRKLADLPRVYDGFILETFEDYAFAAAKREMGPDLDIKACTIEEVSRDY